jgi:hypothetical protein
VEVPRKDEISKFIGKKVSPDPDQHCLTNGRTKIGFSQIKIRPGKSIKKIWKSRNQYFRLTSYIESKILIVCVVLSF